MIKDTKKFPRTATFGVIVLFVLLVISFMSVMGLIYTASLNSAKDGHDAILVLGAGLKGDKVSLVLKSRLDTAIDYAKDNPESVLIMSGGQGEDELVSEAYAMKEYAVKNGIDESRVLMEDQSTSTGENFKFSKIILDEHFEEDYTTLIVTSDYHIFRSNFCAYRLGMAYDSLPSPVNDSLKPKYVLREYFAVMVYVFVAAV